MLDGTGNFCCQPFHRVSKRSDREYVENVHAHKCTKLALSEKKKQTRMIMMKKCSDEVWIEDCEGEWYCCAHEVLQHNRINTYVYADVVRDRLTCVRGNFRNMIVGPSNCAKIC